jgi:hypothetical protein
MEKPYRKMKAQGGKVVESLGIYRIFGLRKMFFFIYLRQFWYPDTGGRAPGYRIKGARLRDQGHPDTGSGAPIRRRD